MYLFSLKQTTSQHVLGYVLLSIMQNDLKLTDDNLLRCSEPLNNS